MEDRFRVVCAEMLSSFLHRIETCVALLSEDELWLRPNPAMNSAGNLLLHLHGNLSQWVLDGLGGETFERHRSREFSASRAASKAELLAGLRHVVGRCQQVAGLPATELTRRRSIQGYDTDGVYVLVHVVEHMSYHTGQIVSLTKLLRGPEAGIDFYPQHRHE